MNYEERSDDILRGRDYNSREQNKEIFSLKYNTNRGKRTYYFDLKKSPDGTVYLVISESRKHNGISKRDRVLVFEEDILSFLRLLKKTISFMLDLKEESPAEEKSRDRDQGIGEVREERV